MTTFEFILASIFGLCAILGATMGLIDHLSGNYAEAASHRAGAAISLILLVFVAS